MKIFNGYYKLKRLWENIGLNLEDYVDSKIIDEKDKKRHGFLDILMKYEPSEKNVKAYETVFGEHFNESWNCDPIKVYRALARCGKDIEKFLIFNHTTVQENTAFLLLNILFGENALKLIYDKEKELDHFFERRKFFHGIMAVRETKAFELIDDPQIKFWTLEHALINRKFCEETGGYQFLDFSIGDKSPQDFKIATCMSYKMIELKRDIGMEIRDEDWQRYLNYLEKIVGKIIKKTPYWYTIHPIITDSIIELEKIKERTGNEKYEKYLQRAKGAFLKFTGKRKNKN